MLDAALDAGLDAPYSCPAVCVACRAKLVKGKATMAVNYALEPGEVEGICAGLPSTRGGGEDVVLDFDQQ